MKFTKKTIYISLFAILYLIVAFSSFFHACAFFGLANNSWMSIILAFAFEVGQAAVLFSLLTSKKDRSRVMPWVLMGMFTLVQVIGNVYSSYKYIITNSVENLRYFKEPIFIWTDLPDTQANVIIVYLVGALLPIAALLLTSMITNYLTDQSEENNKVIEIHEETQPKLDGPPEGEGLSDKQEIENLNVAIDKKKEEINRLKQEIEELKHPIQIVENSSDYIKENGQQTEIDKDKSNSNDGKQPIETNGNQTNTESGVKEDTNKANIKTDEKTNGTNDRPNNGNDGIVYDSDVTDKTKIENIIDKKDIEKYVQDDQNFNEIMEINNNIQERNKQSHFINL